MKTWKFKLGRRLLIEYALLLVLLFTAGWLVVYGRGSKLIRAALVVALMVSSIGLIERVQRYRGTPRKAEVPEEVMIHGFMVSESTGSVYLFCGGRPPDNLEVTYTRNLHKALRQGRQQGGGQPFKLVKNGDGEGDGQEGEGGDGEAGRDLSTRSETDFKVVFPKPKLPEKRK